MCLFNKIRLLAVTGFFILVGPAMAGCAKSVNYTEQRSRESLEKIAEKYRPAGKKPTLPTIDPSASLGNLLLFGILNDPAVEVAYYQWRASIERIAVARALPDPRLTFEMDIADSLMSTMLGFMFELPGRGKLSAMAEIESAESQAKFYSFKRAVLNTAANIRNSYYQMQAVGDAIKITKHGLRLLKDLEDTARVQHEAGKVTLQDVLRAEIERERLLTELQNIEDSQAAVQAGFKAALGLDPRIKISLPAKFTNSSGGLSQENLLAQAFEQNPSLKQMQAEIRKAEAELRLAKLGIVPDISFGLDVDIKQSPFVFNPELSVTLPIWREKIAAQINAARAESSAAQAQLSREQIDLAVEFAAMIYMYAESKRNLSLYAEKLIPRAEQSVEIARAGYIGGKSSFVDFLEAERSLIEFERSKIEARMTYENTLTKLSLLIAGVLPKEASFAEIKLEERQ